MLIFLTMSCIILGMREPKFQTITVRIDDELRSRIEEVAEHEERSMSYIVNRILKQSETYDFDLDRLPQERVGRRSS